MTDTADTMTSPIKRKPRLALMGEFSAGKSTLTNMLLGCNPLPVRVTATRLPPVWISHGSEPAYRVGHDGTKTPYCFSEIDSVDLAETRLIRLFLESEALELCDLIDMPGISDPNMSSEVWKSVISEADAVVWCTHATQAWRQSEAATWAEIKDQTNGDNLLLITQFDKLNSERDRSRVLARVRKETDGLFQGIYPISLLDALNAEEDEAKWKRSGADAFTEHLVDLLLKASGHAPRRTAELEGAAQESEEPQERTVPRRVQVGAGGATRPRPSRPASSTTRLDILAEAGGGA